MNDFERNDYGMDKRAGETRRLKCSVCKRTTNHKVLRSVTHDWATADFEIVGAEDYMTVQCQGCDEVSYCTTLTNSEDWHNGECEEEVRQFPERDITYNVLDLPYNTPLQVQAAYLETYKALSHGITHLGAVGIRWVIELLCKAENGQGEKLFEKINSLKNHHIISEEAADMIHRVRFLGNDAAHDYGVKKHELDSAWQALNIIIQYIYGARDSREVLSNSRLR